MHERRSSGGALPSTAPFKKLKHGLTNATSPASSPFEGGNKIKPILKNSTNLSIPVIQEPISHAEQTLRITNAIQQVDCEHDSHRDGETMMANYPDEDFSIEDQNTRSTSGSLEVQYSEYVQMNKPDKHKLKGSPFIHMYVMGKGVDAIPDTGSERTICSAEQAEKIFGPTYERLLEHTKLALRSATGHKLKILGLIPIPMLIGQSLVTHKCVIIEDNQLDFIIGNDLMLDRASLVKGRFFEVNRSDNGVTSTVPIQYCNPIIGLTTTNRITISPQGTTIVKAKACLRPQYIKHYIGHTFLIHETQNGSELHDVIDTISDLSPEGRIDICIGNATQEDIQIGEGELIGQAEIIFPDDKLPGYLYYSDLSEDESRVNLVSCQSNNEAGSKNESRPYNNKRNQRETGFKNESRPNNASQQGKKESGLKNESRPNNTSQQSKRETGSENEFRPCNNGEETGSKSELLKNEARVNFVSCQGENDKKVLMGLDEAELPDPPGYELPEGGLEEKPVDYDSLILTDLTPEQREKTIAMMRTYDTVFSKSMGDFGRTDLIDFTVDTGDALPFHDRYRPIPIHYEDEVREIIAMMLKTKVIEPCESPWVSNVVLVAKPGRRLRVCINLRGVNKLTRNISRFPITHPQESIVKLAHAKYFFQIDLSQAYYCIPLTCHQTRQRTAFQVLGRQYQFLRGPFGLSGLPSAFNYLVSKVFDGCQDFAFFFFDDVIGIGNTFEEYFERFEICLKRLLKANMRINWSKSRFCLRSMDQIEWLGSIIYEGNLYANPKKIQAVLDVEEPVNRTGVRKFMGMANFMLRHLPQLGAIAAPLHEAGGGGKKRPFVFTNAARRAFEAVKRLVKGAQGLAIADKTKNFFVTVDSSDLGTGAILTQKGDDEGEIERTVQCCSRKFNPIERKMTSCERELLGIKHACQKFGNVIIDKSKKFTLRSDAKALVYLKTFKDMNAKMFRKAMDLDRYNFDIVHQSATKSNAMGVADMLSRKFECTPTDVITCKQLKNPILDTMGAPEALLTGKHTKEEFDALAGPFGQKFVDDNNILDKVRQEQVARCAMILNDLEDIEMITSEQIVMFGRIFEDMSDIAPIDFEEPQGTLEEQQMQLIQDLMPEEFSPQNVMRIVNDLYNGDIELTEEEPEEDPESNFNLAEYENNVQSEMKNHKSDIGAQEMTDSSEPLDNVEELPELEEICEGFPELCEGYPELEDGSFTFAAPEEEKDLFMDNSGIGRVLLMAAQNAILTREALEKAQAADGKFESILKKLKEAGKNVRIRGYFLKKGILMKEQMSNAGKLAQHRVCVPEVMVDMLMKRHHGIESGVHVGPRKMYRQMQKSYYWNNMQPEINELVSKCHICQLSKINKRPDAPLVRKQGPVGCNHTVAIDIIGPLTPSKDHKKYILTCICEFSKYCIAIPLRTKEALPIARAFMEQWVQHMGCPKYIRSDLGSDVNAGIIQYLTMAIGSRKILTSAYGPEGNSYCERMNGTIKELLRTKLFDEDKAHWTSVLPHLIMAYNHISHTATGIAPVLLMRGKSMSHHMVPLIPLDHPILKENKYMRELRRSQSLYCAMAKEALMKERAKRVTKQSAKPVHQYYVGDMVLKKIKQQLPSALQGQKGLAKLLPRYDGPYRILWVGANKLKIVKIISLDVENVGKSRETGEAKIPLFGQAKYYEAPYALFVHPRDCKAYKDSGEEEQNKIDSFLAREFLSSMGVKAAKLGENLDNESSSSLSTGSHRISNAPSHASSSALSFNSQNESAASDEEDVEGEGGSDGGLQGGLEEHEGGDNVQVPHPPVPVVQVPQAELHRAQGTTSGR